MSHTDGVTTAELAACPKHMVFGPCGGVEADGTCEVGDRRCVFVDGPTVRWERAMPPSGAPGTAAARMRALLAERAVVVADLSVRPMSTASAEAVAGVLAGVVDAVLVGDGPGDRVQFPPAHRAAALQRAGLAVWSGLNCRDRNRVALEGELAALADVGVAGVHCVTGDHPGRGHRPDAAAVFDLDGTRLAALAVAAGHLVSVAEAPAAPPVALRPERLLQKLRTGAEVCFVDHCGGAAAAAAFVARARDLGATCRFIACVPLLVDAESAAAIAAFPSLVLPQGLAGAVAEAADPRAAGIDAAVRMADDLLAAGLDGVDLSGGAGRGDHVAYAEAVATVTTRLLH